MIGYRSSLPHQILYYYVTCRNASNMFMNKYMPESGSVSRYFLIFCYLSVPTYLSLPFCLLHSKFRLVFLYIVGQMMMLFLLRAHLSWNEDIRRVADGNGGNVPKVLFSTSNVIFHDGWFPNTSHVELTVWTLVSFEKRFANVMNMFLFDHWNVCPGIDIGVWPQSGS